MVTIRKDEPGAASQPEGDGPVELSDRTKPGGRGSPDTNQATAEPMSPTPDHPQPAAVPTLAEMNVGSADPQSPSHPAGLTPAPVAADASAQGLPGRSGGSTDAEPQVLPSGTAQRVPGSAGEAPAGEDFGVDLAAGAANTDPGGGPGDRVGPTGGPGDTGPSPATGDAPLEGSSEEQQVVTGVRLPDAQRR